MFILRVPDGYNTGEAHAQMYDEEFEEADWDWVSPVSSKQANILL